MKQENRKQHYVPQIYLRKFSGEDKYIHTFDKETGKSYRATINNICCADNLYTVWDLNYEEGGLYATRDLGLEKDFFANTIEIQLEATLNYFLDLVRWWWAKRTDESIIPLSIKEKIAQVIVSQILRMPDMQDYNDQLVQSMTGQISEIVSSMNAKNRDSLLLELKMMQIENRLNPALSQFNNTFFNKDFFQSFSSCLANNYWTLLCSPAAEFYTCDRPVNLCRHCEDVRPMFLGFAEEGAEVSYTINPCLVLTIWDKQHFPDKEKEDGTCRIASRREISHVNVLRYISAKRQIFSVGNEFAYAKQMYERNNNQ